MSEQKIKHNHYPYQVINGNVFDLNNPCRKLQPCDLLLKKPLVPLLVYLTSEGAHIKKHVQWFMGAAILGDLEALQWLKDAGAPWDEWVFYFAASKGHLECLEWLRGATEVGTPWEKKVCEGAAQFGQLEVLQWARANGAPWDESTCASAADNGNFKVLQWARANGAPWDDRVCRSAADNGHMQVLCWAYANGCPCQAKYAKKAQRALLTEKHINWSLKCKERWNDDNRESFISMTDRIVSACNKVTYPMLPTCLSNLVVNYL